MKLGLVICFVLISQLAAKDYYMFSVFILGHDISEMKVEYGEPVKGFFGRTSIPKKSSGGVVRFRAILFKNLVGLLPKGDLPNHEKVNWGAYYATDFELTHEDLNINFVDTFFKEYKFAKSIDYSQIKDKQLLYKKIDEKSFKINVFGVDYKTENTHMISLMTNSDLSNNIKFSVGQQGLDISLYKDRNPIQQCKFNFKITKNFHYRDPCLGVVESINFKIETIKLNNGNNKQENPPWNAGYYKLKNTLSSTIMDTSFAPFMIKKDDIRGEVILVVNSIPYRRFYNSSDQFKENINFNFLVAPNKNSSNGIDTIFPVEAKNNSWNKKKSSPKINYENPQEPAFEDKNLVATWDDEKEGEALSMTAHLYCENPNFFESKDNSKKVLI